jgi:hypothetical protein
MKCNHKKSLKKKKPYITPKNIGPMLMTLVINKGGA